ETALCLAHKARLEQQVLRRIAGHRQLRKGDQVDAGLTRPFDCAADPFDVSFQIADRAVDLSKSQTKRSHACLTCKFLLDDTASFPLAMLCACPTPSQRRPTASPSTSLVASGYSARPACSVAAVTRQFIWAASRATSSAISAFARTTFSRSPIAAR